MMTKVQKLFDQIKGDALTFEQCTVPLADIEKPLLPPPPESDKDFTDLREDIREKGIIVPLIVRPVKRKAGTRYIIIEGLRRYYIAKEQGIEAVNVVIATFKSAATAAVLTLTTNRRRSPNLMAEAQAIYTLRTELINASGEDSEPGTIMELLTALTGFSKSEIERRDRLRAIDPGLRELYDEGRMTTAVAEGAAKLSPKRQAEVLKNYKARVKEDGENARVTAKHLHEVKMVRRQEALTGLPAGIFNKPDPRTPVNGDGHDAAKAAAAVKLLETIGWEYEDGVWVRKSEKAAEIRIPSIAERRAAKKAS